MQYCIGILKHSRAEGHLMTQTFRSLCPVLLSGLYHKCVKMSDIEWVVNVHPVQGYEDIFHSYRTWKFC